MKAGVEERRVFPGDEAALGLGGEAGVVQLRLVRHVHRQTVQVVHVVSVGCDLVCNKHVGQNKCKILRPGLLTLSRPLPGEDNHAVHICAAAEVDHEDWLVHVVIVHDGTVGQVSALPAVHRQTAVPVLPLLPRVSLVIHPRLALERLVRHCNYY